ncbi:MAG: Transcriptional regulator, AcrR family [uncultured Solirubrobacteraceae bacterium]|uniref:Transcriptional regulator, AcrR family n=1 Tax=uncultured Solirubrobacteraceae bacterium TaxID=1162706 RepID=A0A6J4U0E1_9ACTN|nr:MAG: Transcriptional regulator, AcrR family [uncultured Solirubrobacteraceae bacterium]
MARSREFDEQTVLRAAAGVFRRRGYAGASLQELTEATGLGKGSLYGAYGSKHGLYLAALDQYTGIRAPTTAASALDEDEPAIDVLRDYLSQIARASTDGSPSCMLTSATAELSNQDEEVAHRVADAFDALASSLRPTVERALSAGDIDPEADPQAVADMVLAIARGIEALGHAGTSRERLLAAADAAVDSLAATATVAA